MKKGLIAANVLVILICISAYAGHVQKKEVLYTQRSNDLAKIWHSASELYGYWDQVGGTENWDRDFGLYQERLWDCRDEYDYYVLLEEMLAGLKDGHSQITAGSFGHQWVNELSIPGGEEIQELNGGNLPIGLSYVDGKYLVSERTSDCPIPMYSEITTINGIETDQYMEQEIAGRIGLFTDQARERKMGDRLCVSRYGDKIKLTVLTPAGTTETVKLKYGSFSRKLSEGEAAELGTPGELLYDGQYLDVYESDGLCYVRIYSINAETVVEEFENFAVPALPAAEGLILDLRYCNGGNITYGYQILRMLVGDSVRGMQKRESLRSSFEMRIAKQMGMGMKGHGLDQENELVKRGRAMLNGTYYYNPQNPDSYSESVSAKIKADTQKGAQDQIGWDVANTDVVPYDKLCVMLIGPGTASAGESMAILAQDAGIPLIGSHTAGIEGDLALERLSNGWIVGFSCGNSYGPNGELIWNRGVYPDVEHEIAREDWIAGKDTTLLRAMEYINHSAGTIR